MPNFGAGMIKDTDVSFSDYGITACFPVIRQPMSLNEAVRPEIAKNNSEKTAEQVFRLIASSCSQ